MIQEKYTEMFGDFQSEVLIFGQHIEIRAHDGSKFYLSGVRVVMPKTIRNKLREGFCEMKFCCELEDDSSLYKGVDECWKLVLFPMYDRNDDEVIHGTIVPYEESAINGNFLICGNDAAGETSNHSSHRVYDKFQPLLPIVAKKIAVQLFCEI